MTTELKISAVILSGGAGRRFDGLDKGLYKYAGKPLIEHVINAIAPQVDEIILCVNRNQTEYQRYGFPLVEDHHKDRRGPIAGVSAAIDFIHQKQQKITSKCLHHAILISSCDSPNLPSNYVSLLVEQLTGHDVAVIHDGERRQNLHCLIAGAAWPSLSKFFDHGGRAMHRWFEKVDVIDVDFSHQKNDFSNINSPLQIDAI